jgi:hypothetical protein
LTFLKAASRHFEIYLCTFGTATYAREVRHKLVELTGPNTLNSILISREQLLRPGDKRALNTTRERLTPPVFLTPVLTEYRKDLDSIIKIIGNDVHPSFCVLIDDRHDVWSEDHARENLLRIHPYSFFLGHSQSNPTPTQHHRRSEAANHLSHSQQESILPSSLQSFTSSTPPLSAPVSMRLNRSTDSTARHFTEMVPADSMPEISLSTSSIDDKCLQNAWGVLKCTFYHRQRAAHAPETNLALSCLCSSRCARFLLPYTRSNCSRAGYVPRRATYGLSCSTGSSSSKERCAPGLSYSLSWHCCRNVTTWSSLWSDYVKRRRHFESDSYALTELDLCAPLDANLLLICV